MGTGPDTTLQLLCRGIRVGEGPRQPCRTQLQVGGPASGPLPLPPLSQPLAERASLRMKSLGSNYPLEWQLQRAGCLACHGDGEPQGDPAESLRWAGTLSGIYTSAPSAESVSGVLREG
jgi:hypothetical protein